MKFMLLKTILNFNYFLILFKQMHISSTNNGFLIEICKKASKKTLERKHGLSICEVRPTWSVYAYFL